jgi:hypothetical protein
VKVFDNFEDAARESRTRAALSPAVRRVMPNGEVLPVRIVKPLYGQPFWTYASSPGMKVRDLHLAVSDVDSVREWKPF